jgi:ABC-type antimicrobial peptide transport system permease subunit
MRQLEPNAVFYETRALTAIAEESAAVTRLATRLLGGFVAIALLLASVGVYGVKSYRVRLRRRQLGARLALGASPRDMTRMVRLQASAIAAVGLAAGIAAALVFARALSAVLFEITPWDPATLAQPPRCSRLQRSRRAIRRHGGRPASIP